MSVKLVCVDVDGTLVGSRGQVPAEVWPAVERVRAAGIHLALCSGRPAFGMTRGLAELLNPGGWHVFQNGASIVNVSTGESRSHTLPPQAVGRLVERARTTGQVLELYSDGDYAVENTADRARRHAELLGVPFRARDLLSLRDPVVRAQWLVSLREADDIVAEAYPELSLARSLSPVMPGTAFVNITTAGVDKASGVRAVARAYGVPLADVMMVGDAENDLVVLRAVGWPVAMGNAEPAVRAVARTTVGHVDEGGLAEALALIVRSGNEARGD